MLKNKSIFSVTNRVEPQVNASFETFPVEVNEYLVKVNLSFGSEHEPAVIDVSGGVRMKPVNLNAGSASLKGILTFNSSNKFITFNGNMTLPNAATVILTEAVIAVL